MAARSSGAHVFVVCFVEARYPEEAIKQIGDLDRWFGYEPLALVSKWETFGPPPNHSIKMEAGFCHFGHPHSLTHDVLRLSSWSWARHGISIFPQNSSEIFHLLIFFREKKAG